MNPSTRASRPRSLGEEFCANVDAKGNARTERKLSCFSFMKKSSIILQTNIFLNKNGILTA